MKIKEEWISQAKINKREYLSMYENSIIIMSNFWKEQAEKNTLGEKIYSY